MVRCKQQDAPDLAPAPREDEWVQYVPPLPGFSLGAAMLSERAVVWVIDAATVVRKLRGLRQVEHDCLDEAEKKGLIKQ